jgi:arylsulfatase A-like enzyme
MPRSLFPAALIGLFAAVALSAAPAARPNIVLIYSDDHGWADLGAQGADPHIRTPHLDALARDGVRFTRGYVTAPQCVPSRAGVITGRYQQRFGVDDNGRGPLPLRETTIAERLKPAGYVSVQIGKWHLEPPPPRVGGDPALKSDDFLPGKQGFDEYYCGAMNTFVASHDLQGRALPGAPQRLNDPRFRCVWQADAAVSFVNRRGKEPFFMYLAFYTPHVPLESPEPWFSRTPERLPLQRRQALAMMAAMDDGIGRLRAALAAQGVERNTLIFFIGDNGAPLRPAAWNGSLNLPLVGEKGMLTDGGVRTPFVAAWPGTLPAGRVYDEPVSALDVAATAHALSGLPADPSLDGVNLVPFVTGAKSGPPHEALYWRWRSQAAVLEDRWKLVLLGAGRRYLFDTRSPDGETRDLAAQQPEIAARLFARLKAWDATLQTPGLPQEVVAQDRLFFDVHVDKTAVPEPAPASNERGKAKRKKTP